MIEAFQLTKIYGKTVAVDNATFRVENGSVTGFLGPNGAGKSTAMRMIVGLDNPTSGEVLVDGKPFRAHRSPMHTVGAVLDAKSVHPGRSAWNHLRQLAATHGISQRRIEEVLEMTGIAQVKKSRVRSYSLGMSQRLGIAAALLGDPRTLVLDEPVNGLDPEGVRWVRNLCREMAREGRTVFISSHLMSEMSLTADRLIIIGRGRIMAQGTTADIINAAQGQVRTLVRSPQITTLIEKMGIPAQAIVVHEPSLVTVYGFSAQQIGEAAAAEQIAIHELTPIHESLEDAFLKMTASHVEYHSYNPYGRR